MSQKCLEAWAIESISKRYPGTTFKQRTAPDTRSFIQKMMKRPSTEAWKSIGTLEDAYYGDYGRGDFFTFTNGGIKTELRFNDAYTSRPTPCVMIETLAPAAPPVPAASTQPTEEDPTLPGGRRRRSRVKKQTRRTQRKRRNTVRR
jgi:hypothetical protein